MRMRGSVALAPGGAPILMHWGVDLAVPPEKLVHNTAEWNARSDLTMSFATTREYFDA